jgi:hypothetical protein
MAVKKASATKATTKRAINKSPKNSSGNYTQPELREKIKEQVLAGGKGGRPGQWSARKAQLVVHEYETHGGGYKRPRNTAQKSLKEWGDEQWRTANGNKAVQGAETHRYLPHAAWKKLSPAERKATDVRKVTASRRGQQYVANTPAASRARKRSIKHKS